MNEYSLPNDERVSLSSSKCLTLNTAIVSYIYRFSSSAGMQTPDVPGYCEKLFIIILSTLKFIGSGTGTFSQKRSSTTSKQNYDMKYEISGKTITFDCPVIDGTWEVSGYTENTMTLTLLPGKNGLMILVKE